MTPRSDVLAMVGATLIDGTGRDPVRRSVVLIKEGRIIAVGDSSMELPTEVRRVDARGKFIIPGLMDANVHLVLDYWPLTLIRYEGRYDELVVEASQVALKNGLTTVFDTWGPLRYIAKARADIDSGRVVGSRIFFAGNIVGLGGPFSEDFLPEPNLLDDFPKQINTIWENGVGPDLVWKSPDQIRAIIRDYAQSGIDFVKFAVTTHRGDQRHIMFSPRVQQVLVEEARRAKLTVQTHTTTNEGLDLSIRAGVDLIQHVDLTFGPEPVPEEILRHLVDSRIPGAILPQTAKSLSWYRDRIETTPWLRRYEVMDTNARALIKAKAQILLSTDAGLFSSNTLRSSAWRTWQPSEESLLHLGEGHFHWLLAVEQKGMDPMEALQAATSRIARAYKVDRDLGTIEQGKKADLLVLDRDPLASAQNYRTISTIIKDGQIVDRESLPTTKLLTAPDRSADCDSDLSPAPLWLPCSLTPGQH